ncbi:TauD/TfdA family dioxygenase [Sphingomonas sp. YL-JM2C]
MDIRPLSNNGAHCVVEVVGLDPDMLKDAEIRQRLYDLWVWNGVVVFRGLSGADVQLEISRICGDLQQHPVRESWVDGHPDLINLRYTPEDGSVYEVDGKLVGAYLPWHSDLVYVDKINHGGVLRPVEPAREGGATGFIDQIASYDRLPARLRERIESLDVIYKMNFFSEQARFGPRPTRRVRAGNSILRPMQRQHEYPRVLHPMVYTQTETGRKVLNVSPWFAVGIQGMENADGDALLEEVIGYCTDESYAYFHQWKADDMVLWDNWRVLHCATGVDPDSRRWMQRTTILGDYALGRVEGASAKMDESLAISI